jgi:hypothetical protein
MLMVETALDVPKRSSPRDEAGSRAVSVTCQKHSSSAVTTIRSAEQECRASVGNRGDTSLLRQVSAVNALFPLQSGPSIVVRRVAVPRLPDHYLRGAHPPSVESVWWAGKGESVRRDLRAARQSDRAGRSEH